MAKSATGVASYSTKTPRIYPAIFRIFSIMPENVATTGSSVKVYQSYLTGPTGTADTTRTVPRAVSLPAAGRGVPHNLSPDVESMLRYFKTWLLAAIVLGLGTASVHAQEPPVPPRHWTPFGPSEIRYDLEMFRPPDESLYGNGPPANHGLFFSYERLFWLFTKPEGQVLGSETAAPPESNSFIGNTIFPAVNTIQSTTLKATGAWGNRWEIGYMGEDNQGWLVSVLDNVNQTQIQEYGAVEMQFDDPGDVLEGFFVVNNPTPPPDFLLIPAGKMQVVFDQFKLINQTKLNGVELMRTSRLDQFHNGGYFEWLYGARFLSLNDRFGAVGLNILPGEDPTAIDDFINPLMNSRWYTEVDNNMVGPQIGARWFRENGRWTTSLEARFLAAVDFQTVKQKTELGNFIGEVNFDQLIGGDPDFIVPAMFNGQSSNSRFTAQTFSPVGEWRFNVAFQLSEAVSLKVGYTGMIIGNVMRAANRSRFDEANLISLLHTADRQVFLANGVNFGIEINR